MALIDIIKGMAGGAEAIQANFQFGSIVESGTNENGTFVKFGNGLAVCFKNNVTFTHVGSTAFISGTWTFPMTFVGKPSCFGSPRLGYVSVRFDAATLALAEAATTSVYGRLNNTSTVNFATGDTQNIGLFAVGMWK